MSKKIMERKASERKEKVAELEKMAASGSGEAKKETCQRKKKAEIIFIILF